MAWPSEREILDQKGKAPAEILQELFALDLTPFQRKGCASVGVCYIDLHGTPRIGFRAVSQKIFEKEKPKVSISDTTPKSLYLDFGSRPEWYPAVQHNAPLY